MEERVFFFSTETRREEERMRSPISSPPSQQDGRAKLGQRSLARSIRTGNGHSIPSDSERRSSATSIFTCNVDVDVVTSADGECSDIRWLNGEKGVVPPLSFRSAVELFGRCSCRPFSSLSFEVNRSAGWKQSLQIQRRTGETAG